MPMLRIVLVTAAAVLVLAALSRAPYTPPRADAATLRYSWRLSVSATENCRPRTQAELDALPVHMRTPTVCTPVRSVYSVVSRIGSEPPDTLHAGESGARGDRPIYVLHERVLSPGPHRVRVELLRTEGSRVEALAAIDTVVVLESGVVRLLTLDPERGDFVVRGGDVPVVDGVR
jgi:hypothetical protein